MNERRAWFLAALLWAACSDGNEGGSTAKPIDDCEDLPPITLSATPSRVRVNGASSIEVEGGSGHYSYALGPDGSGGELRGARLVAGPTPANDRVTVSDDCGGSATIDVEVVAAFQVQPTRARIRPGTSFRIKVEGTLGTPSFRAEGLGSGGSLSDDGQYTAGPNTGLDLVVVRDEGSGEEALLQYRVDPEARFRGAPERLALPYDAQVQLRTVDGSGVVRWSVARGPGSVQGDLYRAPADARGDVTLEGIDEFTQERAQLKVRVLDELTRQSRPHGRLTDRAALVTGDFDGDGIEDVALGLPESDLAKPTGGAVFVFKGAEQGLPSEPTWIILGEYDTANLGAELAVGDLDGDGRDELAISEPGADITMAESGAVLLYTFGEQGPEPLRAPLTGLGRGNFGTSLAIADVDGDGDQDLVVGAPAADLAPSSGINNRGVVDVFLLDGTGSVPEQGALRIGGSDLAEDGKTRAAGGLRFGRALAVADFNGDGRVDLASLGQVNNSLIGGAAQKRTQMAVAVHFGRPSSPLFADRPDLYILPSNSADSSEGTFRLFVAPPVNGQASRLLITSDQGDSPDLTASGGVKSGNNAGAAYLYDLSDQNTPDAPPETPTQLGRGDAFARIWGDASGIAAGRSASFSDLDGNGSIDLVLGAPYASHTTKVDDRNVTLGNTGKLLVFPYAALSAGSELNKPSSERYGTAVTDMLGVAVQGFAPGSARGLVALAARASSPTSDFTGRLDAYLGQGPLAERAQTSCLLPARVAAQQHGVALELLTNNGQTQALLGAPGFAGRGSRGDGNDLGAGQALLYRDGAPDSPQVIHEGAGTAYTSEGRAAFGGRMVGQDVAVSDFNGDGRADLVVAAPQLSTPTAATEFANDEPTCLTSSAQSNGGALVFLGQADGSYKEGFRLFAVAAIDGCAPADAQACKRREMARNGLTGGFDFNGDGRQDVLLTRANGLEVFLGRAPTDTSLAKPSMACDPVFSLPALAQNTSAPSALGDLDGDGCDEVAVRYANSDRSGLLIAFGFDPSGARCGGHAEPAWLRLSGDAEMGLSNMQLGVASARAGRFLGGTSQLVAVSAALYPFEGVRQPAVLLYEAADLAALRPTEGQLVVGALSDGLTPVPLVFEARAPGFGRAIAGGTDVTGDGIADLVVSAPGVSLPGGGTGAVYVFAGGEGTRGQVSAWLTMVGDDRERAEVGQELSLLPARAGAPAVLGIGAPLSYRSGTANGTAWLLPLQP